MGLEPNWPIIAVQSWTTGMLPGPVDNTRDHSLLSDPMLFEANLHFGKSGLSIRPVLASYQAPIENVFSQRSFWPPGMSAVDHIGYLKVFKMLVV